MKFFEDGLTKAQLNQFRFEVLRDLASGKITAREAKNLCGVKNAIDQSAVFVAQEDRRYLRMQGGVSALSH